MRPLHPALLAILSLGLTSPASATLATNLFVSSEVLGIPTMNPSQQAQAGPLRDDFDFFVPGPARPSGEIHVFIEVDYGILRLDAFMQIRADAFDPAMVSLDSGSRGSGSFTDIVTIDAPGLAGTSGTFVPVVQISGSLDADATGEDPPFTSFSSGGITVTLTPGSEQRSRTCDTSVGSGPDCFFGDPLGIHEFGPVAFVFGSPFQLGLGADAATFNRTVPGGSSLGDADFRTTVRWLGFEEVRDAGQGLVTDFTVDSQSGVDWSQPVPEPGAGGAGLAALVVLAALRRGCELLEQRHRAR